MGDDTQSFVEMLPLLYWAYEIFLWRAFDREKPHHTSLGIPLDASLDKDLQELLPALKAAAAHPSPRVNPRGVWEQGYITCLLKQYLPADGYTFLDIGCGKGFLAAITDYFYPESRYTGVDILESEIKFSKSEFTSELLDFIRIRGGHSVYGPESLEIPENFPIGDGTVDLVFGLSTWTHFPPDVAIRYLREMARVLKSGGYFIATFHLITDERNMQSTSSYDFNTQFEENDRFYYQSSTNPIITARRDPVAVEAAFLETSLGGLGLEVVRVIPGCWRAQAGSAGGYPQDCVVARMH